jgi:hypothetical protein
MRRKNVLPISISGIFYKGVASPWPFKGQTVTRKVCVQRNRANLQVVCQYRQVDVQRYTDCQSVNPELTGLLCIQEATYHVQVNLTCHRREG